MIVVAFFAISLFIFHGVSGAPDRNRLRFDDRREPEGSEYRTFNRRGPNSGSASGVQNVFQIPIAAIQGTSAAAQAFSPQNSQTIQSIFDIPVATLDAVGNYIKESRPQRLGNNIDYNNDVNIRTQRPLSSSDERRQEHRERLLRLREEERERRKAADEERLLHHGQHTSFNIFSSLAELLIGGGGHNAGNIFGNYGHGHGGKPPKRPSKPIKPGNHGGHGSYGNLPAGNGNYEVYEQVNDGPTQSSGIFSWLQTAPNFQADDNEIQNKIAPGPEFRYNRQRPKSRFS